MSEKKVKILDEIIKKPLPLHLAIILDGNGRWAQNRGLPRIAGHQKGAKRLEEIVNEVKKLGIKYLTVYAFSTENWNRDSKEVNFLMTKAEEYYTINEKKLDDIDFNILIIGEETNLTLKQIAIKTKINNTCKDKGDFTLIIAFNYGGKKEFVQACKNIVNKVVKKEINVNNINESLIEDNLYTKGIPDVDFLIRTSGEERISNFLLWKIAYAEMYFPKTFWPDFNTYQLYLAIHEYQKRNRRFGGIK